MTKYTIELTGCDAETIFDMDLTDEEKLLLDRVAELAHKVSTCNCEPTIKIKLADVSSEND